MSSSLRTYGLLAGTIIGVGIFGLPVVAVRSGILPFAIQGVLVAFIVYVLMVLLAEVTVGTKGEHRIPGLAEWYLGTWGKCVAILSNMCGFFGAQLAYLIAGGTFLSLFLSSFLPTSALTATLLYFALGTLLIYRGVRSVGSLEVMLVALFLLTLLAMGFGARDTFMWERISLRGEGSLFVPYGVLLFSFWGMSIVPTAIREAQRDPRRVRFLFAMSLLTAFVVYALFTILVSGVTGSSTTEDALSGLQGVLPNWVLNLGLLFGLATTFSSYIALGLVLTETLAFDFGWPRCTAWLFSSFLPLTLYLIGARGLLAVLSVTGAIFLGVEGLILLIVSWAFREKQGGISLGRGLLMALIGAFLVLGVVLAVVRM